MILRTLSALFSLGLAGGTFARLTIAPAPLQVVERRRVGIMKHSIKTWNE